MKMRLGFLERCNTGEHLALEQLKRSTAAGGNVRHLLSKPSFLHRGDRVTTTDDGRAALARQLSESVGDGERSLRESLELEDTHGAVPDDRLAVRELLLDLSSGGGAVVEAHPALRDRFDAHNLRGGIRCELVRDDHVRWEDEGNSLLFGHLLQLAGKLQLVILHKRRASLEAAGLEEREDHASANHDLVHLRHERLDHANLGGDLGAADDRSERALGLGDRAIEVVELLLQQEAGD
mmetsp:Transcript_13123/g.32741  ORF Transcript_13123/g.32741 Transcript_13123/m.32741 type:complete len:237 (+) Transcript_13123:381-1091(+)